MLRSEALKRLILVDIYYEFNPSFVGFKVVSVAV